MRYLLIIFSLLLLSCESEEIVEFVTNGEKYEDTELDLSYAPECYPVFSWDKVPLNGHFSKDTDNFTDEEAEFIANTYSFVTLEKNQGNPDVGADIETPKDAALIKQYNSDCKVLLYWNTRNDYGDMWSTGSNLIYNPTTKDTASAKNFEWILYDGVTYYNDGTDYRHRFDPRNEEMSLWWTSVAVDMIAEHSSLDGIFADGVMSYVESSSTVMTRLDTYYGAGQGDAYRYEGLDMLGNVTSSYNNQNLVIANCIRAQRSALPDSEGRDGFLGLDYCHGGMLEHFACPGTASYTKDYILQDIEYIETASSIGKITVVKGWPRYKWTDDILDTMSDAEKEAMLREDIVFPLACYLLGAGEYSYFAYSWGYRMEHGWMYDYEEFNKPLGAPQGAKVKVKPGDSSSYEYTREFEHAHVWVDIESFTAEITWL